MRNGTNLDPIDRVVVIFLLVFILGALWQGCCGRPANAFGGISSSAERMASALERIATVLEKEKPPRN